MRGGNLPKEEGSASSARKTCGSTDARCATLNLKPCPSPTRSRTVVTAVMNSAPVRMRTVGGTMRDYGFEHWSEWVESRKVEWNREGYLMQFYNFDYDFLIITTDGLDMKTEFFRFQDWLNWRERIRAERFINAVPIIHKGEGYLHLLSEI